MPEQQIGQFVLEAKIGAGAMGTVYLARHVEQGQKVAIKVLPSEFSNDERSVARFEREIEILERLQHPNIVRCYGGGRHAGRRYFAMELVNGGSLSSLLRRRGRLSCEQTIDFGLQICAALEHAHAHSIIHRDLKPSNLLLTKDGKLKLADFGLARDMDATGLTATGRTMGTFCYMAPEQIRGKPPVSYKTDLYALGCVLFEMLTGRPPFEGDTPAIIFYKHLEEQPPSVATIALDCPVWLDAAIAQLLEKDPAQRPMDAMAVAQTLHEAEERIAREVSTLQQAASGGPSMLSVDVATTDVRKLLGKKKRKRRTAGPVYERAWFLAGCLALVIAAVAWALWPMNERKLFAKAEALMAGDDPVNWQEAYDKYLEPLRRRFPNGQYVQAAQEHIDKVEMYHAEARFHRNTKAGRDPQSEPERLYANALKYEKFGDRVTALEKYQSMIALLKDQDEEGVRPFVNLARRQAAKIEQSGDHQADRIRIVNDALAEADKKYEAGETLEARKIWNSIVALYASNREMDPQVKQASARLAGRGADEPQNGTDTESNDR
jgi:serine/threonine protein kinase